MDVHCLGKNGGCLFSLSMHVLPVYACLSVCERLGWGMDVDVCMPTLFVHVCAVSVSTHFT